MKKEIIFLIINIYVIKINSESPFEPNEDQIKAHWYIFKSNHGKLLYNLDNNLVKFFYKLIIKDSTS